MLSLDDFTRIGKQGLGNPRSQIAHSMAMFNGHLYLGVTHPKADGPTDAQVIGLVGRQRPNHCPEPQLTLDDELLLGREARLAGQDPPRRLTEPARRRRVSRSFRTRSSTEGALRPTRCPSLARGVLQSRCRT